jgi:hypothetical protein
MIKTLIGKNNYLFLTNNSCDSLYNHANNISTYNNNSFHKYINYINKKNILMFVFPDKELICKQFLPSGYGVMHRPNINAYKSVFGNYLIDGLTLLDYTDYYKTDTHINNKGALKVFLEIIKYLNDTFNVQIPVDNYKTIECSVTSLSSLSKGIGDLTWDMNKGYIILNDISDIYYKFDNIEDVYLNVYNSENNYLILNYNFENISNNYVGILIDWKCLSSNILYIKNDNFLYNKRVIIFYDSFLVSSLSLYKTLFKELFLIKNCFNLKLINKINPDFIIEARIERFLC